MESNLPPDDPGPLPLSQSSDRCPSCNTPLASDQRYCINCGERRGKPRFGISQQKEAAPPPAPKPERRLRTPAGLQLIAGVATLLLAMGVGVLIGQNGSDNQKQTSTPAAQVITVNGGGGTGASSGGTSTTASTGNSKSKSSKSNSTSRGPVAHLTKKTTTAVNSAAQNSIGTKAKLAPPTTQVGGKCTNGEAGCQNGTFTGNFFGGG